MQLPARTQELEGEQEHQHGHHGDAHVFELRQQDLGRPLRLGRLERGGQGPDENGPHEDGQKPPDRRDRALPGDGRDRPGDEGPGEEAEGVITDLHAHPFGLLTAPAPATGRSGLFAGGSLSWSVPWTNAPAISRKCPTTSGSNWVPEQRMISLTA
ncbi:MAG: hypothetical protein MZV64_62990 [Ignavibacteriales bacterium]|nr:hypothetical protein [Ignavibacteriales bacterium]